MVVRSPCQDNYPADAHPSAHKSLLESANPAWTRSVHLDAPGQRHGQRPISRTADPGVKQDKSSRGSVDTTKTRSGSQRVRMSSDEKPIGAAKGKPDTEALCQPPPPHTPRVLWKRGAAGGLQQPVQPPVCQLLGSATRKRHQQEQGPQRLSEHSGPTQQAKGRTGDCPGPYEETATRQNVTQGGGGGEDDDANGIW